MIWQKGGQVGKGRQVSQDRELCGSLSMHVMQEAQGRTERLDIQAGLAGS